MARMQARSLWTLLLILPLYVWAQECATDGTCDKHERCPVWKEEGECLRSKVRTKSQLIWHCQHFIVIFLSFIHSLLYVCSHTWMSLVLSRVALWTWHPQLQRQPNVRMRIQDARYGRISENVLTILTWDDIAPRVATVAVKPLLMTSCVQIRMKTALCGPTWGNVPVTQR